MSSEIVYRKKMVSLYIDIPPSLCQFSLGWLEGELLGRVGMFPDNFATKIADPEINKKVPQSNPFKSFIP